MEVEDRYETHARDHGKRRGTGKINRIHRLEIIGGGGGELR